MQQLQLTTTIMAEKLHWEIIYCSLIILLSMHTCLVFFSFALSFFLTSEFLYFRSTQCKHNEFSSAFYGLCCSRDHVNIDRVRSLIEGDNIFIAFANLVQEVEGKCAKFCMRIHFQEIKGNYLKFPFKYKSLPQLKNDLEVICSQIFIYLLV